MLGQTSRGDRQAGRNMNIQVGWDWDYLSKEMEQHVAWDVPRRQRTLGNLHMALSLGYFLFFGSSLSLSLYNDEGMHRIFLLFGK